MTYKGWYAIKHNQPTNRKGIDSEPEKVTVLR